MPRKKRSQLSKHSPQAILEKIRHIVVSFSENSDRLARQKEFALQSRAREFSSKRSRRLFKKIPRISQARANAERRSQRLMVQRERQQSLTTWTRNRILTHSNGSAFS